VCKNGDIYHALPHLSSVIYQLNKLLRIDEAIAESHIAMRPPITTLSTYEAHRLSVKMKELSYAPSLLSHYL
jgi:hypothetical protein